MTTRNTMTAMKTTMKLNPDTLIQEIETYKKFKRPSKYKDGKASVLIALKPPKYTCLGCASISQAERSYESADGSIRSYKYREKDECPYRTTIEIKGYGGRDHICALFGSRVGYRGQRLELCKYVFGKRSKTMIKNWRPIKQIDTYIRGLIFTSQKHYIERLYTDVHIGKAQRRSAIKALTRWVSDTTLPYSTIDDVLTQSIRKKGVKEEDSIHWSRGCPCTAGGSMLYGRWSFRFR